MIGMPGRLVTVIVNWKNFLGEPDQRPRAVNCAGRTKQEKEMDAVEFARKRLGFEPDATQELVLRGGRRGLVNCTRQWGKSTVTAAKAVHRAYTRPGSLVLVVAPCGRQSGEFVKKAEEFVGRLGMKIRHD